MHLSFLIQDLAVILGVGAVVSLLCRYFKQPVVLGYLIAGIVVGPHTPAVLSVLDKKSLEQWAELGIVFLTFGLGLDFSFRRLTTIGLAAVFTAILELSLMACLGLGVASILGLSWRASLFFAPIIAISSTTIILKVFEEKGLKNKRFAELVFALLIVEDLATVLILVALSNIGAGGNFSGLGLFLAMGRLSLVIVGWLIIGLVLVPRFVKLVSKRGSDEVLVVASVGLCLGLVVTAFHFQYSVALGAFIMGSILAETNEAARIEHLIMPLKYLFGSVFFVSVGMLLDPSVIWEHWRTIGLLCLVILIGKTLAVSLSALLTGKTLATSLRAAMSMAQIGEFSFVITALGLSYGMMDREIYPIIVTTSILTTFFTPYFIDLGPHVVQAAERWLPRLFLQVLERYSMLLEGLRQNYLFSRTLLPHRGFLSVAWIVLGRFWETFATYLFKETRQKQGSKKERSHRHLAPWDANLVELTVSPESSLAGKTLLELQLRERFKLNIVVVCRGEHAIVAPKATERLFPEDRILCLGKDDDIDKFTEELEKSHQRTGDPTRDLSEYVMMPMAINSRSGFDYKSIRYSGIREEFDCLVVGLEREKKHINNPHSDLVLRKGDILWVVGYKKDIYRLQSKFS